MKTLVADDDFDFRLLLKTMMPRWGFEIINANDGVEAWQALQGPAAPQMAILDWSMPGLDGVEVCRLVREDPCTANTYLLLVSGRHGQEDLGTALAAGADEYLVKPVEVDELRSRLLAARRVVDLQERLTQQTRQLEQARQALEKLRGLFPVCHSCGKHRKEADYWKELESYLAARELQLPLGGLCRECQKRASAGDLPKDIAAGV